MPRCYSANPRGPKFLEDEVKASTAAALLRASRARFEAWGVLQLGRMEMIALEFAAKHTKDEQQAVSLKEMEANGVMGINRISKDMYLALRSGYKALEALPPNTELQVAVDGTEQENQATDTTIKPPAVSSIPDWMKEMGISEDDINGATDDTHPTE